MNTATAPTPPTPAPAGAGLPLVRLIVLAAVMVLGFVLGEVMRPSLRLAEVKPPIKLEQQIPEAFGEWRIDRSIRPILPDPSLQAMLDSLYSQVLARTYINAQGQRIMLSIAYGSDQSNEATAVHRPEFCYSAQGFRVAKIRDERITVGATEVPVARVRAALGQRIEPITYWVTLDEAATLPGFGRKWQQIRYGVMGQIPDGMLVRISSISANDDEAFALQQRFMDQMYSAVPADVRNRYFGSRDAAL
jgi:EpsI family protein